MEVIPPISMLLMWESRLEAAERFAVEQFAIKTKQGWLCLQQIKVLMRLHSLKDIREAARKEVDWLNVEFETSFHKRISQNPGNK